jgi:hypothetical protein
MDIGGAQRKKGKNSGSRHQQQIHKLSCNDATRSQNSGYLQHFFEYVVVALGEKKKREKTLRISDGGEKRFSRIPLSLKSRPERCIGQSKLCKVLKKLMLWHL